MLVESLLHAKRTLAEWSEADVASAITKAVKSAGFVVTRMRAQAAGVGRVRLLVRAHASDETKVVKAIAGVPGLKKDNGGALGRDWAFTSDDGVSVSVHEAHSTTLTGNGEPEDVMEVTIVPPAGNWGGYD